MKSDEGSLWVWANHCSWMNDAIKLFNFFPVSSNRLWYPARKDPGVAGSQIPAESIRIIGSA